MIALAILEQLTADITGLEIDKNCFYEELPLQHDGKPAHGVWAVTRGGAINNAAKSLNLRSTVDFYVAFKDKLKTDGTHHAILGWIATHPTICELDCPYMGGQTMTFYNVRIRPTSTPQNTGATENGDIVKFASIDVIYDTPTINQ